MKNRFRFLAALLALLALSTSVVEQAWAAACLGTDGSSAAVAPATDAAGSHAHHGSGADAPPDHQAPDSSDPDSCPMTVASGMVCGVAALPVAAAAAPIASESHVALLPAADEAAGSLALSALFRPPRR